ncbi:hypothetical protein [Methylobacterium sp. CM6244]
MQVATDSNDTESHLVFADGFLVAILVQLSEQHEHEAGKWFLEAGFGRVHHQNAPKFANLDVAQDWIERQLTNTVRLNS